VRVGSAVEIVHSSPHGSRLAIQQSIQLRLVRSKSLLSQRKTPPSKSRIFPSLP